ncbi:trans-Golgi network-localized SYP41-interacting protein 1 isoform X2 [Andrographis paniculata]|uniref:trans-Golgi network-localized SYP41-interacting protein 1 isoform X2 n=1 Tax=Andrographis paniculata TaxID=175694 RepID=UPI0021E9432A|nr:trans-Golgi network-localized SYP41-interacting protein 1 isoform X2 [Andrographis paniculata]
MDKNKNRTDLLAAGRKKLQQFRQKKDNKGSNSKSSGKAGKSGHDAQPQAGDGETSKNEVETAVAISESTDTVDSMATDVAAAGDEISAKGGIGDAAAPGFPSEGSGIDQAKLNQSGKDGQDVDSGVPMDGRSSALAPEDTKDSKKSNSDPTSLNEQLPDSGTALPVEFSSDRQDGGEQVTDDVERTGGSQSDKGTVKNFEEGGTLPSSGFSGNPDSGTVPKEEEINVAAHSTSSDSTLSTGDYAKDLRKSQKRQGLLVLIDPSESSDVDFQQAERRLGDSPNGKNTEALNTSGSHVNIRTEGEFPDAESSDVKTTNTAESFGYRKVDLSPVLHGSTIQLSQLSKILQVLDEDEFRFLFASSLEKYRDNPEIKVNASVFHDTFERLQEQLYVTSFSKDAMQLQLCEQQKLVDKLCAANASQIEGQEKNEAFNEDITTCRRELQEVALEREELQKQHNFSKTGVEDLTAKVNELQNKLEMAQGEISSLSSELLDCRSLVGYLQTENENLNGSLKRMAEEKEKLLEENRFISLEKEKLSGELAQSNVSVESERLQAEHNKALDDLKEATICIDQLTKEKDALNADLEFLKGKLDDLNQKRFATVGSKGAGNDIDEADWSSLEQLKAKAYDDAFGFFALKRNLGNAEMMMRKLENAIEGMHLRSYSLSKAATKVSSPKVSRLIHAFETKNHVDEQDPEKNSSFENQSTEDLYLRAKMFTDNLRVLLEELVDDAENASEVCRLIQNTLCTEATNLDRSKYTTLREDTDQVERANIELMVLSEVMRLHGCDAAERENELLSLCNALQKQELTLASEKNQLREKVEEFEIKIHELQSQLDLVSRDADEKVASISDEMQTLKAEVAHRELILEEQWRSVSAQVIDRVGELYSTVETVSNTLAPGDGSNDIVGYVAASVRGACKMIEDLRGQLESALSDRKEILDRSNMTLNALHNLYDELSELVITFRTHQDKTQSLVADNVPDLLHDNVSSMILNQLKELLGERLQLESENHRLNAELVAKLGQIDDLDKRCLKSDTIMKLVEEIEHSVMLGVTGTNTDDPFSRLETLILLLAQKYKEADKHLSLSKSLEMQFSGLQGQVDQLHLVLVQYENENLVLKDSLKSTGMDIVDLNTKLKEKIAELEQSEQRVLSVREKLSRAVTKGKGLISKRDSLEQSLAETSKELDKCTQELSSKDAKLHELETKLRVYSEAGERMEALESELSYIRNSATALRESFLLKDSVLQRIEEILEDIELPEHFHLKSTIEKVEWLAKSTGGNSQPIGDWEQRSSMGGASYSDTGLVGAEALKDSMQPNLDSIDDLRRRYDELENKYYGIAEQNEMLEQSLIDMNNLLHQWEGILDRVDMPSQLRSMEPEDKIQWLENAFSAAQNHCYSLQKRVHGLESFCESLAVDAEDSQRRTSELVAAFQLVCVEKEITLLDLEILSHENEEISKKIANLEVRNENLQYEVSMFQEDKIRLAEDAHHTNDAIRRVSELVCDALQEPCTEGTLHGREGVICLEEMLRKLVEKYNTSTWNPVSNEPIDVHAAEKEEMSYTSRAFDEQDVESLRKELEDSAAEYMILKEERDGYMLKNQSLLHEVEELEIKKKELHELLNQEELKSASLTENLSKKLESCENELRILKEEKERDEISNQSLLCQIEDLEMKSKDLKELLNQEELRSASLRDTLNKKLEDSMGELSVLKEERDRYVINNQSFLHEVQELEMKRKELEDLLHQEKLKSSSLQELLSKEELNSVSLRETLTKKLEDYIGELTILKEGKDKYMLSNQTLQHEVEALGLEKRELQELLSQEELKSATVSQKVQDTTSVVMILKEEKESLVQINQSLLHEVEELEMRSKELQELLNQEERKSASLAETLQNVQDSMGDLMNLKGEKENLVQNNQALVRTVEELELKKKELQETLQTVQDSMGELILLKGEKENLVQNNQTLVRTVEELEVKRKELQELLNQEEQKSSSLREKLNVAVRKGKSLVQQRDRMNQVMEEQNAELERLRSESQHSAKSVSEYEEQTKNLLTAQERLRVMESETAVLRSRVEEFERSLQEKDYRWNSIVDALEHIDLGNELNSGNPYEKIKYVGAHLTDLHTRMDSLEQETRKSKRAAELLLTELNEVQERNDNLQDELAKAGYEFSELSREKDLAEKAKREAFAKIENLYLSHSEEKDRHLSETMVLRSSVDSLREDISSIERELNGVLFSDFEVLQNLKAVLKSLFESGVTSDFDTLFSGSFHHGAMPRKSENKVFMNEIDSLRELIYNHSHSLQQEASQLFEVVENVHRGYNSHKGICESMKKDVQKLESIVKEKESELHILQGNISLLYETCGSAISEIENLKHVAGNAMASRSPARSKSQIPGEGLNNSANGIPIINEEGIRSIRDNLLLVVRDIIHMQNDLVESGQDEMKRTISNLQKELQEKDIQRDRVCTELVNQIKEAETNAKNHLHELQQVKMQLHDAQRKLNAMEEEHKVLDQTIKELKDQETDSNDLRQKVNSLTEALAAKVQENEALMQALDAQEAEMEDLTDKVAGLENELQQKNKDLENLETSRAKALKKLSVTVGKFDELHHFSESLLSEVEKLQSQLQERDSEVSFLRQEVTRCTNDALTITELQKSSSDEIRNLLSWLDSTMSKGQMQDIIADDPKRFPVVEYKAALEKKILDLISELENLRLDAQKSDILLQKERSKVEDLTQKEQYLINSLDEKESQLVKLKETGDSSKSTKSPSEIVEVDAKPNKWASSGTIAPQVRSLRKTNNDQVAIAIDVDQSNTQLEDDDDKAHGFKSLTTSKFVPRFTRPVSDLVDGLWVSCDRALMRQPALRLTVMLYWAVLHALLATFVV